MSVLTTKRTRERVYPVDPLLVRRRITWLGENRWRSDDWGEFPNAHSALMAVREDVLRTARHTTDIDIEWANVPADFVAPTTGTP